MTLLRRTQPNHRRLGFRDFSRWLLPFASEDLHFGLIETSTSLVIKKLRSLAAERNRALQQLELEVELRRAGENSKLRRVVGVDAGHNGENLASAFIPLYSAAATLFEGGRESSDPILASCPADVWPNEPDPLRRESLLHFALQFHVVREAVGKWKPDVVLVDGPILPNPLLRPRPEDSSGYRADFVLTLAEILLALEECNKASVSMVGFIKRPSTGYFHRKVGSAALRDSILLNPIMQVGDYTKPRLVDSGMNRICARFAENLGVERPTIYAFYIKSAETPPYRVEIPAFCLKRVDEVASLLISLADLSGIPHPIAEADRRCKLTRRTLLMYRLVLHEKALSMVNQGAFDPRDLDFLTPRFGEWP